MDFLQSKKIIWVFGIVAIVAVALAVVVVLIDRKDGTSQTKTSTEFKVTQRDVDQSKLPDKFPADIPLEQGAKITQNYSSTTADGHYQATREFETKKTLAENVKLYTDYFKKNGWIIGTGIDQPDFKVVSATKGNLSLQVTIQNLPTGVNIVSISAQELK